MDALHSLCLCTSSFYLHFFSCVRVFYRWFINRNCWMYPNFYVMQCAHFTRFMSQTRHQILYRGQCCSSDKSKSYASLFFCPPLSDEFRCESIFRFDYIFKRDDVLTFGSCANQKKIKCWSLKIVFIENFCEAVYFSKWMQQLTELLFDRIPIQILFIIAETSLHYHTSPEAYFIRTEELQHKKSKKLSKSEKTTFEFRLDLLIHWIFFNFILFSFYSVDYFFSVISFVSIAGDVIIVTISNATHARRIFPLSHTRKMFSWRKMLINFFQT